MNLETITDMLWWCKTWPLNKFHHIRAKQKPHRKRKGAYESSWSRPGNQKSFTLTAPWNLARPVKIFRGIIVRRPHTVQKQMSLLREQYAELEKGHLRNCSSQVWMKIGGWSPWNATAICEIFKTDCLMGRHRTKGVLVNHL